MRATFAEFVLHLGMQTLAMIPSMIYQSLALTLLRPLCEAVLVCKHPQTPGRIVSLLQGLCVSYWIAHNDYFSAIASTLVYFVVDYMYNFMYGSSNSLPMHIHHWAGAALCYFSVHTHSWDRPDVGGELTRSLILMETTNVSFHSAFMLFHEFDYAVLMVPALLHFFVVRVLRLGVFINPFNKEAWEVLFFKTYGNAFLLLLCLSLWALQIAWCAMWTWRLLQEWARGLREDCKKAKQS